MIEKLDPNDYRPITIIDKINEIIDALNERHAPSEEQEESE